MLVIGMKDKDLSMELQKSRSDIRYAIREHVIGDAKGQNDPGHWLDAVHHEKKHGNQEFWL